MGVVTVQTPSAGGAALGGASHTLRGVAAVAVACVLSGLAGVTLERIVKQQSSVPIWLRNIQLGVISTVRVTRHAVCATHRTLMRHPLDHAGARHRLRLHL